MRTASRCWRRSSASCSRAVVAPPILGRMESSTFTRPEKGAELDLHVDALAYGGNGIARMEGYVVFVAGAIPGDRVRAVVTKRKRAYAEARTLEVLEPSPERIEPLADHP